jgi:hypothetical protein
VDRDGELLVGGAISARFEVFASGLDVVEVRDDADVFRDPGECFVAVAELAGQRERRVLFVVGRGPADEASWDGPGGCGGGGAQARENFLGAQGSRCW